MAAGPELSTTYTDLLLEMKGPLVENYSKYSVLLSELNRNTNQKNFSGTQVRVPIIRNPKQGTGFVAENSTLNVARNIRTTQAHITVVTQTHAVSISRRLKEISKDSVTSWGEAMKLEMQLAEEAMPRVANECVNGNGDGLLGTVTDTANSTTLTLTGANPYQMYPGRVVDVLVRSSGAVVSLGREISSYDESTGIVTLDAAVNHGATHGIYLEGSYGNVCQGITQATAQTGSFEGITISADWKAVDGRNGDTTAADLSISIMDACIRRRGRNGKPDAQFWLGDFAVIQKFGQTLLTQSRWTGSDATLQTGWKGIEYGGDILVPDYDAKPSRLVNIPKDDITWYATQNGPDWDQETGNVEQRFNRSLPTEAWLVDEYNVGFHRLNRFVFADNLNQAA